MHAHLKLAWVVEITLQPSDLLTFVRMGFFCSCLRYSFHARAGKVAVGGRDGWQDSCSMPIFESAAEVVNVSLCLTNTDRLTCNYYYYTRSDVEQVPVIEETWAGVSWHQFIKMMYKVETTSYAQTNGANFDSHRHKHKSPKLR